MDQKNNFFKCLFLVYILFGLYPFSVYSSNHPRLSHPRKPFTVNEHGRLRGIISRRSYNPPLVNTRASFISNRKRTPKRISPEYQSCQGRELWEGSDYQNTLAFQKQLSGDIAERINDKILHYQSLKACFLENYDWFKKQNIEEPQAREFCEEIKKKYREMLKTYWSPMRVNLSLSKPTLPSTHLISDVTSWLDKSPQHIVSLFSSLSKLTERELESAKSLFIDRVVEVPVEHFSSEELKEALSSEIPYSFKTAKKYLTPSDQAKIKEAIQKLRKQAKEEYFKILGIIPVISYLERQEDIDNKYKMAGAFKKIEKSLKELREKVISPRPEMDTLLSFKPIVESILQKNPNYCEVAERIRIRVERQEKLDMYGLLTLGIVSAVPCFFTGGAPLCLAAGAALGLFGLYQADGALKESLGKALTGEDIQKFAGLEEKQRDIFIEKVLFPLAFWGTTAQSLVALRNVTQKVSLRNKAQAVLNRRVSWEETNSISKAHNIGGRQMGADGLNSGEIDNYTSVHISRKARVLRHDGFSKEERKLIRQGVVGHPRKRRRERNRNMRRKRVQKQKAIMDSLEKVIKKVSGGNFSLKLSSCGKDCFQIDSPQTGLPRIIRIDPELNFPFQAGHILTTPPLGKIDDPLTIDNMIRRLLIGHELHPYISTTLQKTNLRPSQKMAVDDFRGSLDSGNRSFLLISPTSTGKGTVLARNLLTKLNQGSPKKISFVTVDKVKIVDQLNSEIQSEIQRTGFGLKQLHWVADEKKDFTKEIRQALSHEEPTVISITGRSFVIQMEKLQSEDPSLYEQLLKNLDGIYMDEVHHLGAPRTLEFVLDLREKSGAIHVGTTATPVHRDVKIQDLFERVHWSYLDEGEFATYPPSKVVEQLGRSIERGDITPFNDIYVLADEDMVDMTRTPFFIQKEGSFLFSVNPHYYSRLSDILSGIFESNKKGMIITSSIEEAEDVALFLNRDVDGIQFEAYHSGMKPELLEAVLENSKNQQAHYVVAVKALDEGVNLPHLSAYVDLNSHVSIKQMVHRMGRVLRPAHGKLEADVFIMSSYRNFETTEELMDNVEKIRETVQKSVGRKTGGQNQTPSSPSKKRLEDLAEKSRRSFLRQRQFWARRGQVENTEEKALDTYFRYLQEMKRRFPPLPREEQRALFVEFKRTGNPEIRNKLISHNLRLVAWVSQKYQWAVSPAIDRMDLIQEGHKGLIKAITNYKPELGYQFSTFAAPYIEGYIKRFIYEHIHVVRAQSGTSERQRVFFNLDRQSWVLASQGRGFNANLIADNLSTDKTHVRPETVEWMSAHFSQDVTSFDQPVMGQQVRGRLAEEDVVDLGEMETFGDIHPGGMALVDDVVAAERVLDILEEHIVHFLMSLPPRERDIFMKRILLTEPPTQKEIGEFYGVTGSRVSEIEKKVIRKFSKFTRRQHLLRTLDEDLSSRIAWFLNNPRENREFIAFCNSYRESFSGKSLYERINDRVNSYDDPPGHLFANRNHESGDMPHVFNLDGFLRNYDVSISDIYISFDDFIGSFGKTLSGKEKIVLEYRFLGKTHDELRETFGYSSQEIKQAEENLALLFRDHLQKGEVDSSSLAALRDLFDPRANTRVLEDRFKWLVSKAENLRRGVSPVPWYEQTSHYPSSRFRRYRYEPLDSLIPQWLSKEALDSFEESVVPFLSGLSRQDWDIFQKRFFTNPPVSHERLGEIYGIQSETVINIEKNLVGELIVPLRLNGNPQIESIFTSAYRYIHTRPLEQSLRNFISYFDEGGIRRINEAVLDMRRSGNPSNETALDMRGSGNPSVDVSGTPKVKKGEGELSTGDSPSYSYAEEVERFFFTPLTPPPPGTRPSSGGLAEDHSDLLSSPPPGTGSFSGRLAEDVPDIEEARTFQEDYYPGISLFKDAVVAQKVIDSFSEGLKSFLLRLSPRNRDIFQKMFLTEAPFSNKQLGHFHHISEGRVNEIGKKLVRNFQERFSVDTNHDPLMDMLVSNFFSHRSSRNRKKFIDSLNSLEESSSGSSFFDQFDDFIASYERSLKKFVGSEQTRKTIEEKMTTFLSTIGPEKRVFIEERFFTDPPVPFKRMEYSWYNWGKSNTEVETDLAFELRDLLRETVSDTEPPSHFLDNFFTDDDPVYVESELRRIFSSILRYNPDFYSQAG